MKVLFVVVTSARGRAPSQVMVRSILLVMVAFLGGAKLTRASAQPPVASPPGPNRGTYETLMKADWSTYPDKAALAGQFGVEGGLNACNAPRKAGEGTRCDPHLPVTDFYDLVEDPLFGKVVRYNGGPQLNTRAKNMPGRTALHGVNLGTPRTHVWVRQFIRFSPNWTTASATGGQGAADYKAMFLRYANSPARHQVKIGANGRGLEHSGGNPGLTKVDEGTLPWHNVRTMNVQYHTSGWPFIDFYPLIKAPGPARAAPSRAAAFGNGNGEWVEVIMHHKTVAERGEFTVYWRQYTVRGQVAPQAWKIDARYLVGRPGQEFRGVAIYTMGVNRNRQYDEPMFIYWGPFEIVDGLKYPNPWNLPGG
jgi:hypothetical protein